MARAAGIVLLIIVLNLFGWPVLQLAISFLFVRFPDRWFAHDTWITRPRRFEWRGNFYRRFFAVHRWKYVLPDGAPWMGGRAKANCVSRDPLSLAILIVETRRAELAHWCMLACAPIFFFWNPGWACWVMAAYGLASNLPCIMAQRANRARVFCMRRRVAFPVEAFPHSA